MMGGHKRACVLLTLVQMSHFPRNLAENTGEDTSAVIQTDKRPHTSR